MLEGRHLGNVFDLKEIGWVTKLFICLIELKHNLHSRSRGMEVILPFAWGERRHPFGTGCPR